MPLTTAKWTTRATSLKTVSANWLTILVQIMAFKANIPVADAIRMASETPANIIGIGDRKGTLQRGKDADILILDKKLNVRCVFSQGNMVEGTNTLIH